MPAETNRPLSALLSQVLVAFALELDDEFENQMRESGYAGASRRLRQRTRHSLRLDRLPDRQRPPGYRNLAAALR
jgi:hypothetical protein